MFKIHKKVKYALIALKYMRSKHREELSTAKEICTRFDIPFDPTSRVLQIMTQNEILQAEQGAYGGYRLIGDLTKFSLYDLTRMIIGAFAVTDCCTEGSKCERIAACVLKDPMARLNTRMIKVFKEVKVSEMI
jgi:Rrf2 family protein